MGNRSLVCRIIDDIHRELKEAHRAAEEGDDTIACGSIEEARSQLEAIDPRKSISASEVTDFEGGESMIPLPENHNEIDKLVVLRRLFDQLSVDELERLEKEASSINPGYSENRWIQD